MKRDSKLLLVKKLYNLSAPFYDLIFDSFFDSARKKVATDLDFRNLKVLDLGCGTSKCLQYFPKFIDYFGVDISEKSIEKAQRYFKYYENANWKVDNAEDFKSDSKFDVVLLFYVLSVTPQPKQLLDNALLNLKEGGTIYLVNHFSENFFLKKLNQLLNRVLGFQPALSKQIVFRHPNLDIEKEVKVNVLGRWTLFKIRRKSSR